MTTKTGTREWSQASDNVWCGCENRCRYCYARAEQVRRGKCPSFDAWGTTYNQPNKKNPSRGGRRGYGVDPPAVVMFPTTHDITPDNLDRCLEAIRKNLHLGYEVLIVTKPHLECVHAICWTFCGPSSDKLEFRFSIGAFDQKILDYWEPSAPTFSERIDSLAYAYRHGFRTSVSCEPLLDADNAEQLFRKVKPYVTGTIWIGKMNEIRKRCPPDTSEEEMRKIEAGQTDERCREVYELLKAEPKMRWKKEYREARHTYFRNPP